MSSFFGHSLAAYALASATQDGRGPATRKFVWAGWLIVLASAPDIDYLIPALNSRAHNGLRITHSVAFSLALPLCTVAALYLTGRCRPRLKTLSACAALAGLSHLVLDFLVGVTPLPLLWPFGGAAFTSPFGILPSAGGVRLSNYYFYRNLLIEMGVLAPTLYVARGVYCGAAGVRSRARVIVLLVIAGCFIAWSLSLSR
ncbi:MAG: metal-dependent hydrolase [Acidobacteria bacterium]|nr:metal-dependent hydrolase [Acidobacteriota bacterium]